MSSTEDTSTYPADVELFRYILENAEIETAEIEEKEILLSNGIIVKFDDSGMLLGIETGE